MLRDIAFQQREGACGPASLKMVLHHFGIKKTEKQLIKECKNSLLGVEFEMLLKVVKKYKLKGFLVRNSDIKDIKKFLKKKYMIIIEWFFEDDGHFSVVSNIDKENIYIQDPHLGHLRAIRLDIFKRIWFSFPGKFMKTKNDLKLRGMIVIYK